MSNNYTKQLQEAMSRIDIDQELALGTITKNGQEYQINDDVVQRLANGNQEKIAEFRGIIESINDSVKGKEYESAKSALDETHAYNEQRIAEIKENLFNDQQFAEAVFRVVNVEELVKNGTLRYDKNRNRYELYKDIPINQFQLDALYPYLKGMASKSKDLSPEELQQLNKEMPYAIGEFLIPKLNLNQHKIQSNEKELKDFEDNGYDVWGDGKYHEEKDKYGLGRYPEEPKPKVEKVNEKEIEQTKEANPNDFPKEANADNFYDRNEEQKKEELNKQNSSYSIGR